MALCLWIKIIANSLSHPFWFVLWYRAPWGLAERASLKKITQKRFTKKTNSLSETVENGMSPPEHKEGIQVCFWPAGIFLPCRQLMDGGCTMWLCCFYAHSCQTHIPVPNSLSIFFFTTLAQELEAQSGRATENRTKYCLEGHSCSLYYNSLYNLFMIAPIFYGVRG